MKVELYRFLHLGSRATIDLCTDNFASIKTELYAKSERGNRYTDCRDQFNVRGDMRGECGVACDRLICRGSL
jgi:hypothetical protein